VAVDVTLRRTTPVPAGRSGTENNIGHREFDLIPDNPRRWARLAAAGVREVVRAAGDCQGPEVGGHGKYCITKWTGQDPMFDNACMHILCGMRTTVEIPDERRLRLIEESARNGERGYSGIVARALSEYFAHHNRGADRETRVDELFGSDPEAGADVTRPA
jgi:hypothetical protein